MMNSNQNFETGNLERIVRGAFAGIPMSQNEEINRLKNNVKNGNTIVMAPGGVMKAKGDNSESDDDRNLSEVVKGTFAVPHSDQWYNKKSIVYEAEIAEMKKWYPDAQMGFLESTGQMYWIVNLKMTETDAIKPYTIMLLYDKNHPSNLSYGGSVRSILLDPDVNELRERAKKAGRNNVPHLLGSEDSFVYLCTRLPKEIQVGKKNLTALQAAGFAGEWILSFELGLTDSEIWNNKFCGDQHRACWV